MRYLFVFVVFWLLAAGSLQAQTLDNTLFRQNASTVVVEYQMSGVQSKQRFDVELVCSDNEGSTFDIKPRTLSGAVGENIMLKNGTNTITWQVLSDRNRLDGDKFVFKVTVNTRFEEPEMVFVKGGKFEMGKDDYWTYDVHTVELSDFYMGKYEVTVFEFEKFILETKYQTDADKSGDSYVYENDSWTTKKGVNWKCDVAGNLRPQSDYKHPVIHVSWNDANEYCNWLSKKTGKKYSLPSEAQWEYAAGGGANNRTKWAGTNNENDLKDYAWYRSNSGSATHEVGTTKKANSLGIYDMSGNVWEWCSSWYVDYGEGYLENAENSTKASSRVYRGGGWIFDAHICRVADRDDDYPTFRNSYLGLRLVLLP